ncbi:U3-aranetoxin-Ce1a [Biomphalaria glabrata]|nr:U3-aranetoxin-Ce1a [Biomphalaria glabrata]
MYSGLLWTLATLLVASDALVGKECKATTECDQDECCEILTGTVVMSRRQDLLMSTIAPDNEKGTCQKYIAEGAGCVFFQWQAGQCGCTPGTECTRHEIPYTDFMMWNMVASRPGYIWFHSCLKVQA